MGCEDGYHRFVKRVFEGEDMKIYGEKIIPRYVNEYVKSRRCDLCGTESKGSEWQKGCYEVAETEITVEVRQKEGNSYPEGGSGTKYEIDLCPKCFKNRLIPWLKSQGATIQEEEWDW